MLLFGSAHLLGGPLRIVMSAIVGYLLYLSLRASGTILYRSSCMRWPTSACSRSTSAPRFLLRTCVRSSELLLTEVPSYRRPPSVSVGGTEGAWFGDIAD